MSVMRANFVCGALFHESGWASWAGAIRCRAAGAAVGRSFGRTSATLASVACFEPVGGESEQIGFDTIDPPPSFVKFRRRAEGQSARFIGLQVTESVQASHGSLDLAS